MNGAKTAITRNIRNKKTNGLARFNSVGVHASISNLLAIKVVGK